MDSKQLQDIALWPTEQLRIFCRERTLYAGGDHQTLVDRVAKYRHAPNLTDMTGWRLEQHLRELGLPVGGNRKEREDRVLQHCAIQDNGIAKTKKSAGHPRAAAVVEHAYARWPYEQLRIFCRERTLYAGGNHQTLVDRVAKYRHAPQIASLTVAELQKRLRDLDLPVSGNKKELGDRLLELYAAAEDQGLWSEDDEGFLESLYSGDDEEYDGEGYDSEAVDYAAASGLANLNINPPRAERTHGAGRKKAVVVGVSYRGTPSQLNGTINDAHRIHMLLIDEYNFEQGNMRLLTDESSTPIDMQPKKNNILAALKWLVADQTRGDSLFFYFSGHGGTQEDPSKRERLGVFQTICPMDYADADDRVITDKELNKLIVNPLTTNVTLHALMDSCHSGTVLNLSYNANLTKGVFNPRDPWDEEYTAPDRLSKGTKGGHAYQFSAARRDQSALETVKGNSAAGAATYAFCQAVSSYRKNYAEVTYADLLSYMYTALKGNKKFPDQEPQFSASYEVNMDNTPFEP